MRVLFTSIAFPPKKDPECIQTAKYFKYLTQQHDLTIDVITSSIPTLFMPYAKGMEKYNSGYDQLITIPIWENKYFSYILRKISPELIDRPDSKFAFHRQWRKAVSAIKKRPDIIYSRSLPLSSTIMGKKLKEYFNIPWVLHLSDPWTVSPLHNYNKNAFHNDLERCCFETASAICLTTEATRQLYLKKYPEFENKFYTFPNVFDLEDQIPTSTPNMGEKLKMVYTGGMVGPRNPSYILKAVDAIRQKYPSIDDKIEIVFAGAADRQSISLFKDYHHLTCVKYLGEVDIDDALKIQQSADILFLMDNPFDSPDQAVYLPSKLLDYILVKKRIFAISTVNGTTHYSLSGLAYDLVSHDDHQGIINTIITAIKKKEKKEYSYFVNENTPLTFDAEENVIRLKELFVKLQK